VLLASSILAAFLEEILMRSVLLRALFDQYGGKVALWGSSLIFLAFHMSTQPWWTWPDLFSIGVCLAVARIQGVSIWGIVLIHAIYNSLGVLLPPTGEYPPLWYISVFLVHGYIAAMYGMAYKVRFLKPSVNRL
jgi:membrane protease YdiL (CAAX protease family)